MELPDLAATRALAQRIAAGLEPGDVLGLVGPLGAGKTTLVRMLLEALGGDAGEVVSPTFTLVQHYEARVPLTHVDAYRLSGPEELRGLGHEELFPEGADGTSMGATAIEWADRVETALPANAVWLTLEPQKEDRRILHVRGSTEALERLGLAEEDPNK